MGMQYAPCIAGQSILFPSHRASSQCTHQPPSPLLISRLIALVVLGTKLCCRYSAIVQSCEQTEALWDATENGSCHVVCWVGKWTRGGRAVSLTRSLCTHAGSNDTAFRWLSLLCGIVRGSFQKTAPRKATENTVKHHDGGFSSMAADHHNRDESSVVITTLVNK